MNELQMELYEKLSHLQWLLQRQHLQSHAEYGPLGDPTRGQGRVLAILKMQPEITTRQLSYLLGIRQQSLNELLNKLEKSGYVSRNPSETDKRVMVVRLTEKGKNEHYAYTDFGDMFSCLAAEELTAFSGYLERVITALENQLGVDGAEEEFDWANPAHYQMSEEQIQRLRSMRGGIPHHMGAFMHHPHGRHEK